MLKPVESHGEEQHDEFERKRRSSGQRRKGRGEWEIWGVTRQEGSNGGGRRKGGSPEQRQEREL